MFNYLKRKGFKDGGRSIKERVSIDILWTEGGVNKRLSQFKLNHDELIKNDKVQL